MRGRQQRLKRLGIVAAALLATTVTTTGWAADPPPAAPAPPSSNAPATDWSKGSLAGRVVDVATGKPIAGATVAIQDKNGKVIAWTQTDADGRYTIAADSLKALDLQPSRRRGLLAQIASGVGKIVTAPVKIVGAAVNTVKSVDPVRTATAAAVTSATGNPGALTATVVDSASDAVRRRTENKARQNTVHAVLGERQAAKAKNDKNKLVPGEVRIAVSAPNCKEIKGKAGAYWLDPPSGDDKNPIGARAWLETVKLAPAGSDKKSEVANEPILLVDPRLDPTLAPAGATLTLSVRLQAPAEQAAKIRVFAREDRRKVIVELKPGDKQIFTGTLTLDPKTPIGDTTVTLVALRTEPVEVRLDPKQDDPLLDFARQLDDLEPGHAYEFDPRILASENRLDITLTVLDPKMATPQPARPAPESKPPAETPEKSP